MNLSKKAQFWIIVVFGAVVIASALVVLVNPRSGNKNITVQDTGKVIAGGVAATTDSNLTVSAPLVGSTIGNPFVVSGVANGPWAQYPFSVYLYGSDGALLASSQWTTTLTKNATGSIPFQVSLFHGVPIKSGDTGKIIIVLQNTSSTNTSAQSVTIPVVF